MVGYTMISPASMQSEKILSEREKEFDVFITYRTTTGEMINTIVRPQDIFFGSNDKIKTPCWTLLCYNVDTGERDLIIPMKNITSWV